MKKTTDATLTISADYRQFIEELKARVIGARISAARAVVHDAILLYWDIGRGIVEKQKTLGWGDSVVEMVAADLRRAFPQMTGFSPRNVWYMRRLFEVYGTGDFLQQAVAELKRSQKSSAIWLQPVAKLEGSDALDQFLQQLVAEIPWGQHIMIIEKLSAPAARLWYLRATARFGWSRNVLLNQIKASAYERAVTEKKTHNFDLALPESLPQRGFILQPRVGPPAGLPWVAIHHPHNPIGVVSPNDRYAAIIVCRLSPSGIFHQRPPTVSDGSDITRRDARLFGRCFQNIGLPARDHRRRRRSCSSPLPVGPHRGAIRLGEGNQTRLQPLDQTTRPRVGSLCVAGRIRRFFRERLGLGTHQPLHRHPGGASQKANLHGRVSDPSAKIRRRMGRALRVGLRTQPRWGWNVHANRVPRVAAWPQPWAGGRNPVGMKSALEVATHDWRSKPPGVLPQRGFIPTRPESLPQRGFLLQPRVGPSAGLPWVTVTPVTNPIGVVADETSSLAVIVRVEMGAGK
jgi:predicted nuclease of restriction endonuclease-like (RecB) superfamily